MPDLACPNVNDTIALPLVPPSGGPAVLCRYTVDRFLGAGQFGSVLRCRQLELARDGIGSNKKTTASPSVTESGVCNDDKSAEPKKSASKQSSSSLALAAPDVPHFPENVALKWISCPHADNRSFGKLVREVSVLQRVGAHPHVVQLYHAQCSLKHRTLAIVLEYCAGDDLKAYLQQFRISGSKKRRKPRQEGGGATDDARGTSKAVLGAAAREVLDPAKGAEDAGKVQDGLIHGKGDEPQLLWTLPQATAQELTRQVAEGMLFIWSKGCVHRDLKPANILLAGRPGEPLVAKVADFGFAKQLSASISSQDMAASQVGTPLYAAPEVGVGCPLSTRTKARETAAANRDNATVAAGIDAESTEQLMFAQGAKTDVWSLGVLAFELLTGSVPFRGTNMQDQQRVASTQDTLVVPRGVRPLPPSAIGLLRGTLRADPTHRFGPADIARDPYLKIKGVCIENGRDNKLLSKDVRNSPPVEPTTSPTAAPTKTAATAMPTTEMDRNLSVACSPEPRKVTAPPQHLSWSSASCRKVQHALACARAVALLADRSSSNIGNTSTRLRGRKDPNEHMSPRGDGNKTTPVPDLAARGDLGEASSTSQVHQHKVNAALYVRALKIIAAAYSAAEAAPLQANNSSPPAKVPTPIATAGKTPLPADVGGEVTGTGKRLQKKRTLAEGSAALSTLASKLQSAVTALHSEIENKAAQSLRAANHAASPANHGALASVRSTDFKHQPSDMPSSPGSSGAVVDYSSVALKRVVAAAHQSARTGHLMELRGRDNDAKCCLKVAALLFAVPLLPPSSIRPPAAAIGAPMVEAAAPSLDLISETSSYASDAADVARERDAVFLRAAARTCDERYKMLNRAT